MLIHNYGEVLLCRDITFEDNKIDLEYAHPGIVLLPTTDKNNEVHCLYMTSNGNRALREREKYIKNIGKEIKDSYINIQQIVKRSNIKDEPKTQLNDEQFKEILEKFYKYQISLNPQKPEFVEIKGKIEALLNVLEFNSEFNIENYGITREDLDVLSSIQGKEKQKTIYGISILKLENKNSKKLRSKTFIDKKQKEYYGKVLQVYASIKNIDFERLDFENSNHLLRKVYIDVRNNNYLLNIDSLFNDVASVFELQPENTSKAKTIRDFVKFEQDTELKRAIRKEQKRVVKVKKKIQKSKSKANKKYKNKIKRDKKKYGKFDVDFFDYE